MPIHTTACVNLKKPATKATYAMVPFTRHVQTRQIRSDSRRVVARGQVGWGRQG